MAYKFGEYTHSIMAEARQQYHYALANTAPGGWLDPKTCFWVITEPGWTELLREIRDYAVCISSGKVGRKTLLGLPVRVTFNDEPDIPMVQLVMEPKIIPRKFRSRT